LAAIVAALLVAVVSSLVHHASADEVETDNPAVVALLSGLPAPKDVTFPWRGGRFTEFQAGTELESNLRTRSGNLHGQLYAPPQPGPAPYAILLSGCGDTFTGANILWQKLWARALQDIGIGALALDSFEVRGVREGVCGEGSKLWAVRRVDDIYAAMTWLSAQPQVDRRRIVVMGMSNGGRAALLSVSATENARFRHLAAAVALYPTCDRIPPHELLAPALLLLGGADDAAHPAVCEQFVAARKNTAFPPQVRSYPGAMHLFDVYPRDENYEQPEVIESRNEVLGFLRQVLDIHEPPAQRTAAPAQAPDR
jgi:dienelactone hydrolase